MREELARRPAAAVLSELLLFGPQVAAEAAQVPCIVLNPTINVVPAPGVPPFGAGLMPATNEAERRRHEELAAIVMAGWDEALPVLNAARSEQGLEPLEHVLDQGRSVARVLVMTSRAFDFIGPLPPTIMHVGPRLDDPVWAGEWTVPPGADPLVLVALSADFQNQEDLLRRIVAAVGELPVRAVVTTGQGVDPASILAPANVQVVRAAPHSEVLREAAVAITHCGHGVTIKALAAGVPLVCLPMGRDQLDVAARVVHAGAGLRLEPSAAPEEIAAAAQRRPGRGLLPPRRGKHRSRDRRGDRDRPGSGGDRGSPGGRPSARGGHGLSDPPARIVSRVARRERGGRSSQGGPVPHAGRTCSCPRSTADTRRSCATRTAHRR